MIVSLLFAEFVVPGMVRPISVGWPLRIVAASALGAISGVVIGTLANRWSRR